MVGRVCPRHGHRGRPLNSVVRRHRKQGGRSKHPWRNKRFSLRNRDVRGSHLHNRGCGLANLLAYPPREFERSIVAYLCLGSLFNCDSGRRLSPGFACSSHYAQAVATICTVNVGLVVVLRGLRRDYRIRRTLRRWAALCGSRKTQRLFWSSWWDCLRVGLEICRTASGPDDIRPCAVTSMTPNNTLERTVEHRGAPLRREAASWPAAQLGR